MIDNQTTTHLHHTDSDGRPSGFALFLAPATILLAVAAVFFIPLFTGTNDLPGDLGDARFNIYILETVYLWMSGTGSPLLSPDMFFPFPYTLAFSDTHAATAWIYALFRIAGLDAYDAYKGWVAAGYVLTYLSAYYVGLRFSLSPFLASVAALAFAFSLPSVAQLGHAQLINMAATPFCFLYISRFSEKFASPDLLKFLVALCIQILINIYSGIFTLLISTIFLVVSVAFRHGLNTRAIGRAWADFGQSIRDERPAVPLLIVTVVGIGSCAIVLGFHKYVADLYGLGRNWSEMATMLPRVQSYFFMDALPYWEPVSRSITGVAMRHEHQLFLGVPIGILFGICLYLLVRRRASLSLRIFTVSVLVSFLIVTAFGYLSLYWFVAKIPGFDSLRAISRVQLVLAFLTVMAVACLLRDHLCAGRSRAWQFSATALLALWLVHDLAVVQKSTFSSNEARSRIENLHARIDVNSIEENSVLAYGGDANLPSWVNDLDAIFLARKLGVPTFNGYSGNSVPGYASSPTCADIIRQLDAFDHWTRERGMKPLEVLDFNVVKLDMDSCDLSKFENPK